MTLAIPATVHAIASAFRTRRTPRLSIAFAVLGLLLVAASVVLVRRNDQHVAEAFARRTSSQLDPEPDAARSFKERE